MNAEIKKIIFTADILRPFATTATTWESATWKNVRWLESLLGWQVAKATNLPQSRVSWERNGSFDTPAIYQALGLKLGYDDWAALFYSEILPPEIEKKIVAPFEKSCVIGVEIPDVLQHALSRHQIPFVDIVSHPVRFMEDLLFAFRTNDKNIHQKLSAYRFNLDDHCFPQANLLRAKVAWMPALKIPENTALITGQVATDKALISRQTGRFLKLSDYMDKLFEICASHPLVLFKPHPYQHTNCPSRMAIEAFGVVKTVTHNFYYLIAQEGLSDVYAITSGTTSEAPYFGKKGHSLAEPLYRFDDKVPEKNAAGACIPISHDFLNPNFWADILEPIIPVQKNLPDGPKSRPSLLRRSLNADWDYSYIDEVVQRNIVEVTQ